MKLCVMGLGYIGLPTAIMFAAHGAQVHGVDVNPSVIRSIINKVPHIHEHGLLKKLEENLNACTLTVSMHPEEADVFLISVPTPTHTDKTANLDYVKSAATMILPYLNKGNLVVLESTVPPRTVTHVLIPILQLTGYEIGKELYVSYSPERVLPGKLFEELVYNDRIIGGINEKSCQMTMDLYKLFVKGKIHVTDATTAEMVKLLENTYRDVNIALANEFALIAERIGFNAWEAIQMANSHPRVHIHQPGPGVGGHCIAVDPWFIVEKAPMESKLISMSRQINESMPQHVIEVIEHLVKTIPDPTITLFGLSYKGNVNDLRGSPALIILSGLRDKGYRVKFYDPYVNNEIEGRAVSLDEAVNEADCLVFLNEHDIFKNLDFNHIKKQLRTHTVLDTKNILNYDLLTQLGISCVKIGTPMVRGGNMIDNK